MIELKCARGMLDTRIVGHRVELLAEIPILFGKTLFVVLEDCPSGLREEYIKTVFEMTLEEMKRVSDET